MLVRWMSFTNSVEGLDPQENCWIATKMERYHCLTYKNILLNDYLTATIMKEQILRCTVETTTLHFHVLFGVNKTSSSRIWYFLLPITKPSLPSYVPFTSRKQWGKEVWTTLYCRHSWSTSSSPWSTWK